MSGKTYYCRYELDGNKSECCGIKLMTEMPGSDLTQFHFREPLGSFEKPPPRYKRNAGHRILADQRYHTPKKADHYLNGFVKGVHQDVPGI